MQTGGNMMRLLRMVAVALAVTGTASLVAPSPAPAATGGGATIVLGSGTISPGLTPTTGSPQSVTFTGTAAGAFAGVTAAEVGSMSCSFSGSSSGLFANETSLVGSGKVTGVCVGVSVLGQSVTIECLFDYFRLGPVVTITGTCLITVGSILKVDAGVVVGAFVFVPTTASPTTSYALVGAAAGGGA